ncbi:hypothetical protein BDV59DRAFT_29436 [Aspergillus ambiguus]|uniref:uncharacterized protein n=1 Tax=Aspergillus ambiguus TaxID=176160 RepID=UPI003CCDD37A
MARLCVPGFPFRPSERVPRFKTRPAFLSFPSRRIFYRPTTPTPVPSFKPVFSKPGFRSFALMKKGSRIPIRVVPAHISRYLARGTRPPLPTTVTPAAASSVSRSSRPSPAPTEASLLRLEERRAARQARPRPWAQPRTSVDNQSRKRHLRARPPCPPCPPPHPTPISRSRSSRARPVARPPTPVSRSASSHARRVAGSSPHPQPTVTRSVSPAPKSTSGPTVKATGLRAQRVSAQATSSYAKERHVRFGATTVIPVSRWIVRQEHVHFGPPAAMGHLQGWDVTALPEPDASGEDSKYIEYWGSDSFIMLLSNHAKGPCDRYGCAWNTLARIQAKIPHFSPRRVFRVWHSHRAMIRERGGFAL